MNPIRIFISSVQSEFSEERKSLFDYITTDALLGQYFQPFLFERLPAVERDANVMYLDEVANCDIYLGLFGQQYGSEDDKGVSPTEREFDHAGQHHKTRLIFLTNHDNDDRHPKELAFIKKAERVVTRKKFSLIHELKAAVYASLIRYLEEKEYLRHVPFDAAINARASLQDLDKDKIQRFAALAQKTRGFPLPETASAETVLTHLNLLQEGRVANAAVLLFGKQPQRFFISSEIKCAHFHGAIVTKPIPSYQVYKGDVFQLIDQAVDFVLSKINLGVGTRDKSIQAPIEYELPQAAITEAIVNAVVHRDYTSNGSVQVMLFKNRLEVWNPGRLPYGLTIARLKGPHTSIPANPLLAEPMYLAGYIERMGTGTGDIIRLCTGQNLKEPEFRQEEEFITTIWRRVGNKVGNRVGNKVGNKVGNRVGNKVGNRVGNGLTENQTMLLEAIRQNPKISAASLSSVVGISKRKVEDNIAKLRELGILQRVGGTRGYWEILKP